MGLNQALAEEAQAIVADSLVWDNHACMPLRPDDQSFLSELDGVRASGVDVLSLNVGFGPLGPDLHLAMLDSFTNWISEHTSDYALVHSLQEIAQARADGRMAIFFDVEGMVPLNDGRLDLVEEFRRRGVGWMLFAYNLNNDAGGGCVDEDKGLTTYGRAVLAEMKRVGMIACCSHTGHRTAMEVIEAAGMPVIFSHSNAKALHDHYRNIPDELIEACAATGGVVGINGLSSFLGGEATAARVAAHIDHVAQLVGVDHVGIGLDFVFDRAELDEYLAKMSTTFPDDPSLRERLTMLSSTGIVDIAASLLEKGYARQDLEKILGGNWQRVAAQVWH